MKKNLFFYVFAVLCTMPFFTSCSDDDDDTPVVIPIDEEIVGNYGGTLEIQLFGVAISGDGIAQNINVTKAGDNAISLSIVDFSFVGVQVGDINLENCPLVSTGENSYSFTADPFDLASEDGTMTCTVTLNRGTIVNETLTLDLSIKAQLGTAEQNVTVTFTGERGVTVETESDEAAITAFNFDADYEAHPMHQVIVANSVAIDTDNHTVTFNVDRDMVATEEYADALANLYPTFTISDKATCEVESGAAMDFSGEGNSVEVVVTAENGTSITWTITANLVIVPTTLVNDFNTWVETSGSVIIASGSWETPEPTDVWASANLGCVGLGILGYQGEMAMLQAEGQDGSAAMVQTLDTRAYSLAPDITPGSLFTGTFDLDINAAISGNYLPSTHFGISYKGKPATLNVTYKYEKGTEYVGETVSTEEDKGLIMAVLYEATDASGADFHLDGTNLMDTQYHVMNAYVEGTEGVSDTNGEWVTVSVPFTEIGTYDSSKTYKMAIVCQSSVNGATAQGAIGSKLWIDNIEVVAE